MNFKILMSNLGYLRGINGYLAQHMRYAYRHIYCPQSVQEDCIRQITNIIEKEDPDLCCFVEIDKGSARTRNFNQLTAIASNKYHFFDIENKYGPLSRLRKLPMTRGKSNGFVAKQPMPYEKIFFTHGTKRLLYKINIKPGLTVLFAHFSLKYNIRTKQLQQISQLVANIEDDVVILGDFNIHGGFSEISDLLTKNNLVLVNREDPTFRFHKLRLPLDLCICSRKLSEQTELKIISQPYSDHEALLVTIKNF